MTKAYLVRLEGMGDHTWYLLNEKDWSFLEACRNWDRESKPPVASEDMINRLIASGENPEDAVVLLTMDEYVSDNDIAMAIPASEFDGESYIDYDGSPKTLEKFVKEHNLEYEEAYEGDLY